MIWGAVLLLGAVVGAVELLVRYRDNPIQTVMNLPSLVYITINGLAAAAALALLYRYGLDWITTDNATDPVKAVMIAGLGAMAVMRSSLLKIRTARGEEVSFGPAFIVESLLGVVDRSVARHVADQRGRAVRALVPCVIFERHAAELTAHCLALLQTATADERLAISTLLPGLQGRQDMTSEGKTRNLLLSLLTLMGESALRSAVRDVTGCQPS